VRNNKASDMHPMVDRQIFKDERKRPTEHLVALNHSVCRAILTFLNPFTVRRRRDSWAGVACALVVPCGVRCVSVNKL
jgi:hypothetical protein